MDLRTGKELRRLMQERTVYALSWAPDGQTLISASLDNTIRQWEPASGREIRRLVGHGSAVSAVAYSPDGKTLASASWDETIRLWETATGKEVRRFVGHEFGLDILAWSPDGKKLASSYDSSVLIWAIHDHPDEPPLRLTSSDLEECWRALATEDAARAYRAIDFLSTAPADSIPFLAKHLKPVPKRDLKHLPRLIAELDNECFATREKANEELARHQDFAEPALRHALKTPLPLERHLRVERLLWRLDDYSGERLRAVRATTVLENIATSAARRILRSLARGAPQARLTQEARAALARLAGHDR
jgi:hypothetical protein